MQVAGRKAWIIYVPLALAAAAALSACTSTAVNRAPVEDRGAVYTTGAPPVRPPEAGPVALPGSENAGKPGYYTVRQGDTIMKIATEANQPWREIARWNNLDNPNAIEVGQVLRVTPPPGSAPVAPPPAGQVPVAQQTTPGVTQTAAANPPPQPTAPPPPAVPEADKVDFIWPASGSVIDNFDEASNKGIGIAGKAGDAVLAAADGRVVYAGAGLRGYGNLIILKHNNTYLTAYAHNQTLLVKEDQTVKKGQRIAEMGATDANRVKLHFEVRRSGKPVDPVRYLPSR